MDIAELRQRIKREIDRAKEEAAERRRGGDAARAAYEHAIRDVVAPLFKQCVTVLRAEGLGFQVFTPADSARLVSDRAAEDFAEIDLDTSVRPPRLLGRVSISRSRAGVLVDEQPIAPDKPIAEITDDDVLEFLLPAIKRLVSR